MFQKKRLIELSSSKGQKSVCGFVREKEESAMCRWGRGGRRGRGDERESGVELSIGVSNILPSLVQLKEEKLPSATH